MKQALKIDRWLHVFVVLAAVFGVTFVLQVVEAGPLDVFHTSASTWQDAVNAGVNGVISVVVLWVLPWWKQFGLGNGTR